MKALTLHQPWASLIALGVKTIETRSWSTKYRGRIAIHAGATPVGRRFTERPDGMMGDWWVVQQDRGHDPMLLDRRKYPATETDLHPMPLGAVVATAVLTDCVPMVPPLGQVRPEFEPHRDRPRLFVADSLWLTNPRGYGPPVDVSDQLPFGDFAPDRFAWLLDDMKPTTERCPGCWAEGTVPRFPGEPATARLTCPTCDSTRRCEPVPARGRQGLWEWTPKPKEEPVSAIDEENCQ